MTFDHIDRKTVVKKRLSRNLCETKGAREIFRNVEEKKEIVPNLKMKERIAINLTLCYT